MLKRIFIILILFCFKGIFAQNEGLKTEILNYKESQNELISKGRRLLLDKLIENDIKKVKEINNFLINDSANKGYMVFYPYEQVLIYTWTQEYEELISYMKKINSTNSSDYRYQIKPLKDLLFDKLIEKSMETKFTIENLVNNSMQSNEDKDFIILLFNYILSLKNELVITQEKLNIMADAFLIKYPSSNFVDFVRNQIRYKIIASNWGFVYEFFSGYSLLSKDLSNKFTNPIPFGVAFDINYKKFVLYLRDYIAFTKTKNDIIIKNTTWKKNSSSLFFLPEASLGYTLHENNFVKVNPFLGISSSHFSTNQSAEELKKEKINGYDFTTTYTIGFNIDYKIIKNRKSNLSIFNKENYWFIRLRYAYNMPQFSNKYPDTKGEIHYFTIGFGAVSKRIKRDY